MRSANTNVFHAIRIYRGVEDNDNQNDGNEPTEKFTGWIKESSEPTGKFYPALGYDSFAWQPLLP